MTDLGITLSDLIHRVDERSPSEDPLDRLALAVEVGSQLAELGDALVGHFVEAARAAGHSWARVGGQLGVTKQAAQQKFVPVEIDLTRWTPRARRAVEELAVDEASRLGHGFVGTEHLLLGMCKADNVGRRALTALGVELSQVRKRVAASAPPSEQVSDTEFPRTPLARRALEASPREALRLGHNYVGCEHLLIALAGGEGIAHEVLAELGVTPDGARREVIKLLGAYR